MVSTRQMCGSTADADNQPQDDGISMATRTSVVRRTTHYSQQQHQPASLAYSASVVRRQHSNAMHRSIETTVPTSVDDSIINPTIKPKEEALPAINFVDLPVELIMKIFSFLDYKKVCSLRLISSVMNDICMRYLNSAFTRLINTTYNRFHAIKANMPRRESARRSHPLACECDVIETCYMRLSLLQMSMGKHIERGHCCFFPGAILDEVNAIFKYINSTPRLQRPFRITDELFDLSTMAMEYFRDRIEPTLPTLAYFNKGFFQLPPATTKRPALAITSDCVDSSSNSPPQNHMVLRKGIRKIKQGMKIYNNQLSLMRNELRACKRKASDQSKQLAEQQNLLAEHQKQTLEYANRLDENDKKNEEMGRKFSTLLQELNKCKTELQFWRSKSPAIPSICGLCNQKVTPVLPPEDFQALVNQGVDPESIIINDDTDAESDVSASELAPLTLNSGFAFPDKSTTAKLLAVNTAAKNLKRKYPETSFATVTSIPAPSTSEAAAAAVNIDAPADSAQFSNAGGGYSTKLFYGNHQRSGVIVSPVSMKFIADASPLPELRHGQNAGHSGDAVVVTEQVTTAVATNVEHGDSKKARRVQKANKCVNTHGKRSK